MMLFGKWVVDNRSANATRAEDWKWTAEWKQFTIVPVKTPRHRDTSC